jgi:hypothetical protein
MEQNTVNWLVESDIFDEGYLPALTKALDRVGSAYQVVKYVPFSGELFDEFEPEDCVITYGSINLVRLVQDLKNWNPGSFCTWENYKCSRYYPKFYNVLLNAHCSWMPMSYLLHKQSESGLGRQVFLRPDDGEKTFTGGTFSLADFDENFYFLGPAIESDILVLMARPREITREWRFFVSGEEVITGSLYREKGKLNHQLCESGEAFEFAQFIARVSYKPDPVFSVDVCESEGKLYLLELNCFSCAGFYASNLDKLVEAVNREASLAHKGPYVD